MQLALQKSQLSSNKTISRYKGQGDNEQKFELSVLHEGFAVWLSFRAPQFSIACTAFISKLFALTHLSASNIKLAEIPGN